MFMIWKLFRSSLFFSSVYRLINWKIFTFSLENTNHNLRSKVYCRILEKLSHEVKYFKHKLQINFIMGDAVKDLHSALLLT